METKERLHQIETRMKEIGAELELRGDEMSKEELEGTNKEVDTLKEERKTLVELAEKRNALLQNIADNTAGGEVTRTFAKPTVAIQPQNEMRTNVQDKFSTMEYRLAFKDYVTRGKAIPAEYRTGEITQTTDIGAMIPSTVLNTIVEKLEATGMILSLVTRTSYKGGVTIPTSTVKPVATWVAEGKGSNTQKKTTGTITFAYHKLRCAVAVSLESDTMAISAFESTLANNVVEAMVKAIEQSLVSGDGVGKPKGILSETPEEGQALKSAILTYKDLVDAEAALPQEYENGAVWCMTKKTFMQYYGLQDETGQPIGRVNYGIAGKPERSLLGRTVVVCDYLPSFSAELEVGSKFAFLFNFKDYALNTNYDMGIKKYEDNETEDTITKAVMLVDGKVVIKNSLVTLEKA